MTKPLVKVPVLRSVPMVPWFIPSATPPDRSPVLLSLSMVAPSSTYSPTCHPCAVAGSQCQNVHVRPVE
ncbi:hypothetical protein [Pantoea agglomerans]|uniref:hypothetical protein n=1 Tax=Enterobacter agglomerans TaxID=549 RepID=UPI001386F8BF|nr:hypothetical protein [Pantoea agglomerans]